MAAPCQLGATMPRRTMPRRRCVSALVFAIAASAVLFFDKSGKATRAHVRSTELGRAVERAGGTRIMLGSAAVGAVAGAVGLSSVPVLGSFSAPIGAAAGIWCAQLPEDGGQFSKAGDVCRALGHAATAFIQEFQSAYKDQKDHRTK
eukprot:TRINITY_DN71103_c0_g1_i1.p2 TRINITY_DN71103_c0_g1~~TRINITY_DN71103_c0_g1_i1.p2  ORF type:complete len:147 (-),score=16.98 TRINITY_DN71103_c0_g1_i1:73-513(-)